MKKDKSFKKVTLCHTNDFKPDINDKIKGWIEANGGTWVKEITPDVTHLVASRKAWKRYHPLVKKARRMRTIHIVKYDWLEDSLMRKPVRALAEGKYLYERTKLKPVNKARKRGPKERDTTEVSKNIVVPRDKRIEVAGIEFDNARKEFEQDMGSAGFHPYSDKTGFVYVVTLLRYDIFKSRFEKYKLKLYESDQQPHTYACYMQYTRPGTQKQVLTLAPPGSTWSFSWDMFAKSFLNKVGDSWDQRPKNGFEVKVDVQTEMKNFQYLAPKISEPEGLRKSVNNDMSALSRFEEAAASTDKEIGPDEEIPDNTQSETTLIDDNDEHVDDGHHP